MDIFLILNNYGWILVVISVIKIADDILKVKKYGISYKWTTLNQVAMLLIFFMVTFQIGEFIPINPMFHWPVKKFLLIKDPENATIIYYGLGKSRSGSCSVNFLYDVRTK